MAIWANAAGPHETAAPRSFPRPNLCQLHALPNLCVFASRPRTRSRSLSRPLPLMFGPGTCLSQVLEVSGRAKRQKTSHGHTAHCLPLRFGPGTSLSQDLLGCVAGPTGGNNSRMTTPLEGLPRHIHEPRHRGARRGLLAGARSVSSASCPTGTPSTLCAS